MASLRPSRRSLGIGLAVGVWHLLAVALVWAWLASRTAVPMGVADPSFALTFSYPANVRLAGRVIGLVLLGGIPTVLLLEGRLLGPALVVAAWFAWGVYGNWTAIHGSYLVSRPPLDLYALGGAWAIATSLLGGVLEWTARRLENRLPRPTAR